MVGRGFLASAPAPRPRTAGAVVNDDSVIAERDYHILLAALAARARHHHHHELRRCLNHLPLV